MRILLPLVNEEILQLRDILSATNAPDSLQSRLIARLDAELEEEVSKINRAVQRQSGHLRVPRRTS
jgi:hypothetical protein